MAIEQDDSPAKIGTSDRQLEIAKFLSLPAFLPDMSLPAVMGIP
jgi:hypothetical protein